MSANETTPLLDPKNPSAWARLPVGQLLMLPRRNFEDLQLDLMKSRFESLRPRLAALDKLADRQRVDRFDSFAEALPVFFDHRVYKSYPLSLIEKRKFERLTAWLQRLTVRDLSEVPLDGVDSVDSWLSRLDEHGMIIGHSTGTTGKLSFIPRSEVEWPAWQSAFFEAYAAATGRDQRKEEVPAFSTTFRSGHQMMMKMLHLFAKVAGGGEDKRHVLYDYAISSDLLSLAGRLQAADERGELDQLEIDPVLLEQRKELIERGRHRDEDLERWFTKLAQEFRGQRVDISGTASDLLRIALRGRERGIRCEFAPGSVLFSGGGMKGFKDAPDDWENLVTDFFHADRLCSLYGMSEVIGMAPLCSERFFHFPPYVVPLVLDEDAELLPGEGVQTGRLALFDLLAETYWGAFISGDKITLHWDEDCACGWKGPRIERTIVRFSELEGGDDKITCAGTAQAYSEFMDYVGNI